MREHLFNRTLPYFALTCWYPHLHYRPVSSCCTCDMEKLSCMSLCQSSDFDSIVIVLCNLEDDLMRLYKVQQSQPWVKDLNQVGKHFISNYYINKKIYTYLLQWLFSFLLADPQNRIRSGWSKGRWIAYETQVIVVTFHSSGHEKRFIHRYL